MPDDVHGAMTVTIVRASSTDHYVPVTDTAVDSERGEGTVGGDITDQGELGSVGFNIDFPSALGNLVPSRFIRG